ncbi:MAG: hypothetical protein WC319_03620 [Candidatus Paceibacterota bacterium]|jgi:hypothetical protein
MGTAVKNGKSVKVHTVYKTKDGVRVPGVTTVLGILGKPALIHWAWNLGIEGIDYKKFRDDKADIGTLAHDMVMCHLKGEEVDTTGYTEKQIDLAETCFLKYLEWESQHKIEPVLLETPLVSEKYRYGGTMDNYCLLDGIPTLVDYKTSKAIYSEMFYQLGGYGNLLIENNYQVERHMILRLGRNEEEGFEVKERIDLEDETKIFLKLAEVYHLQKELKNKYK